GERAVLGRGDGTIPDARPDVLVVGGGILGVATAAACAEAGIGSVLLIETGRPGGGGARGATRPPVPRAPPGGGPPSRSSTWSGPACSGGTTSSSRYRAGLA